MQQEQFSGHSLAQRLKKMEREHNDPEDWLSELKREVEANRRAEAEAQHKRDALTARMVYELNRIHTVELLEEMNRVLLKRDGRVEPIFTDRHELCFSWPVTGGRHQIRVSAVFDESTGKTYLLVKGKDEQRIVADETALKQALVQSFKHPQFDIYR